MISGLGWGLGYLGSIACFFLCLPFIQGGAENIDPATFSLAFLVTGIFFACLSLPVVFLFPRDDTSSAQHTGPGAFQRLRTTLTEWRQHREILNFLLAFYLINDAVVTILFFIGIFFKTNFGLSVEEILKLTLLVLPRRRSGDHRVRLAWTGLVGARRALRHPSDLARSHRDHGAGARRERPADRCDHRGAGDRIEPIALPQHLCADDTGRIGARSSLASMPSSDAHPPRSVPSSSGWSMRPPAASAWRWRPLAVSSCWEA